MEEYRKGSHVCYDIRYHFVWAVKCRKAVLRGDVALRLRDLVREICQSYDIEILEGSVGKDHVHLLVSSPPTLPPSKIMQVIKGSTSRKLLTECPELRRQFSGQHLWARGYFAATTGTVTDEMIQDYIRHQSEPRSGGDGHFKVT